MTPGGAQDRRARRSTGSRTAIAAAIAARRAVLQGAGPRRAGSQTSASTSRCRCARSPLETGRIHPVSQVIDEITAIFSDMGFSVAEGPDIETDYYNFTALNFPDGHPAREMHDTFFLQPGPDGERMLLRTHTSPVQIRTMRDRRSRRSASIIPGRTYRHDSDQTHTPMFHQVEGLVIDEESHIGQLRWVLEEFFKAFFEVDNVEMRFRPSFFPFTEPSMEVDVRCDRVGNEISIGEGNDWLEILGCGMVHPNVLRNCGLDPDVYQGFAWGMGIDRIAMLKYGMPDLRAFFDADMRWLDHYGFRPLDLPTLFGGLSRERRMQRVRAGAVATCVALPACGRGTGGGVYLMARVPCPASSASASQAPASRHDRRRTNSCGAAHRST